MIFGLILDGRKQQYCDTIDDNFRPKHARVVVMRQQK